MSQHHEAEAAVRTMGGLGVRAVRLLYTDLHGVARGKDIPIGHFGGMCEEGVAFCAAVMGTDLRHTPVVGGEVGYVDFAIKPDLDTLRAVPWQPEVAWCLGEAWTLDGSEHWPSCPRALLRRVVDEYAARGLTPIVAPGARVLPRRARPGGEERPSPLRRRALPRLHGRRRLGSARDRAQDAALVRRPRAAGVRREPRVHELPVRDQRQALGGARRGRPRVHAQGGGEGDRRARGPARDLHGPPICRPGRIRLPRAPLAERRRRQERLRRRGRARRAEPARGPVHRRRDRARAGAAGAARADDQRLQADPPRQPRPDPRELGPRQPHGVLPRSERARLAGPGRDPDGGRLGLPAPDHRRAPARRASTASSAS